MNAEKQTQSQKSIDFRKETSKKCYPDFYSLNIIKLRQWFIEPNKGNTFLFR